MKKNPFSPDILNQQGEEPPLSLLSPLGDVVAARQLQPLQLPFFDIHVAAGFPIPLNNDELSQNIELMKMLCPNPEASYLIRVHGASMQGAGTHNGDLLAGDTSDRHPSQHEGAVRALDGE